MLCDFIVLGPGYGKTVKVSGYGFFEDAIEAAALTAERATRRKAELVIYVPGDRTHEELAKLTAEDLFKIGPGVQGFER